MGLELFNGTLQPTIEMIKKIKEHKRPTSKEAVRSFLGLLQFVSGYIDQKQWSRLAPLQALLGASKFKWGEIEEASWLAATKEFEAFPVGHFSLKNDEELIGKNLVIQVDASDFGCGSACWVVEGEGHDLRVLLDENKVVCIDLAHRKFSPQECRYPAHDREGAGIFWALQRYRSLIYLFRHQSVWLQSDNVAALARLGKQYGEDISLTRSRRWIRWVNELCDLLDLQCIQFTHIPGEKNALADWLSRSVDVMSGVETAEAAVQTDGGAVVLAGFTALEPPTIETSLMSNIAAHLLQWGEGGDSSSVYLKSLRLSDIADFLRNGINTSWNRKYAKRIRQVGTKRFLLSESGALLYRNGSRNLIVVPDVSYNSARLRFFLVGLIHENGIFATHRGNHTTKARLRQMFWWPNLDADCLDYVNSCETCVVARLGYKQPIGAFTSKICNEVNERIVIDFCGPFEVSREDPNRYVLLAVDAFSGFLHARAVPNQESDQVVNFLLEWSSLFGVPLVWSSDFGSSFVSSTLTKLRLALGIAESRGAPYSPVTQGQVERCCGLIKQGFRVSMAKAGTLERLVRSVCFVNNSTPRFEISPAELFLGRAIRDIEFTFVDELNSDGFAEDVGILREYWRSKINEIRSSYSDGELLVHPVIELSPGVTVIRACTNTSGIGPRVYRSGTYKIVGRRGNGYEVVGIENGEARWLPSHQLVPFDFDAAKLMRVGLPPSPPIDSLPAIPAVEAQVGDIVACEWNTRNEGVRLYVGEVVELPATTADKNYSILYYQVDDQGHWSRPVGLVAIDQGLESTPPECIVDKGTLSDGKFLGECFGMIE